MTWFSSLRARQFALLAATFVIAVACAKVERDYDDENSAGTGGNVANDGGKAGSIAKGGSDSGGRNGSGGHTVITEGGAGGEGGEAGTAGESSAGAAGAVDGAFTLRVSLAGDGAGVVTSDPTAINCGTACAAAFDDGSRVTLTARPAANSTFTGWAGGGCSGTGPCTVIMTAATEVRATFTSIKVPLSVTLAGNGAGNVKSVPTGIDCGTTCSAQVPQGGSVQLTATPATGSLFAGWSGGGCSGTGTCTTTTSAATAVTATFTLTTQTLTVVKSGTGTGTVSSTSMGINCGATCGQSVDYGTVVTLNAAVTGTGSVFTGWSGGGCSGTGACAVTVTAATQVTATFTCQGTITLGYTGAITSFTVPTCATSLTIEAYGAQGGTSGTVSGSIYAGGLGARMKGTFAVTGGTALKVLVGGKGADAFDTLQQGGGSGGGGTFVTTTTNSPLIVAGGGGGAINNTVGMWFTPGLGGSIGTAGLYDSSSTNPGGTAGGGGTTDTNNAYHPGTGGGGLTGSGVNNTVGTYGSAYTPGQAFTAGGAGGQPGSCGTNTSCIAGRAGGFGGGGAAGFTGGGGGGYSGGGAGHVVSGTASGGGGGGGGSYNGGTAQSNTAATWAGAGKVVFTW